MRASAVTRAETSFKRMISFFFFVSCLDEFSEVFFIPVRPRGVTFNV